MKLVGSAGQQVRHYLFDASGTITTGGTAQLVLNASISRSFLLLQNLSAGPLFAELGAGRATATLTNGTVSSVAVTNAGFGFKNPPLVRFLGGGLLPGNSSYSGLPQPDGSSPQHPARGRAVLTAGAISSIVVDDPGAGYVVPPYVFLQNSDLDTFGCSVPSTTSGILLPAAGPPLIWNGTMCPTEAVAIFGASSAQPFTCKWSD